MKVSTREIEQRQMVLEIEVEDERVERAVDQAYKRLVGRINVPGFRRGRAPRALVERMIGRETLLEDAVEHLVPEVYRDALKEQQITAAAQASLEVTSTEPLQVRATVPLEPSVELGEYRAIRVERESIVVEDSEVDGVIERFRESNVTWVPVERPVQIGDRVGLDVVAMRDTNTVIENRDAEFVVNPGGPEPYPGFSEQIPGLSAGEERTFTLGASEGEDTGGPPPTEFRVKIQWVKEKELPAVDDEFARTVSNRETVAELRDEIYEQLKNRKEQETRERQREEILKAAMDQAQVVAPPQVVERQAGELLQSFASGLDRQGISIEQYLQLTGKDSETFKAELLDQGGENVKRSLVLAAIAKAEGLQVSDDELRTELELAARGSGSNNPARAARQAMERPETRSQIETILLSQKGAQRLFELAGAVEPEAQAEPESPATSTIEPAPNGDNND